MASVEVNALDQIKTARARLTLLFMFVYVCTRQQPVPCESLSRLMPQLSADGVFMQYFQSAVCSRLHPPMYVCTYTNPGLLCMCLNIDTHTHINDKYSSDHIAKMTFVLLQLPTM